MTIEEVVISERTRIAKEEMKESTANNMLLKGYAVEIIADVLESTIQKVNKIKSELEKQGRL